MTLSILFSSFETSSGETLQRNKSYRLISTHYCQRSISLNDLLQERRNFINTKLPLMNINNGNLQPLRTPRWYVHS